MAEKKEKQVTFEESLNTSETFFLKNRKMIFGILGAVIVLVVGGILYHSYVSLPREDEASTELAKSEQLMMQQQYDQALKGFQRVAADYGSTDAGNLANLYTALCYAHLQKPDWKKALEYAEKFSTRDDKIISPESQVALADIYVNNDQTDKAIETLKKAAEMAGKPYEDLKIIVCHLGNGASLSAVDHGKSVDTSMGLTPLEGLIMGTRSGDIDPAFVEYLCNKENLTVSEVLNILNKKSGMLGMTGISSDYRDVSAAAEAGNQDAINCLEAYAYRIIKYIGSYIAAMGGVDVITFTAGLGENAIPLRETICKAFEFMGLEFDSEANNCRGVEKIITKEGSKITACVIPTNEEIAICEETVELVKGK